MECIFSALVTLNYFNFDFRTAGAYIWHICSVNCIIFYFHRASCRSFKGKCYLLCILCHSECIFRLWSLKSLIPVYTAGIRHSCHTVQISTVCFQCHQIAGIILIINCSVFVHTKRTDAVFLLLTYRTEQFFGFSWCLSWCIRQHVDSTRICIICKIQINTSICFSITVKILILIGGRKNRSRLRISWNWYFICKRNPGCRFVYHIKMMSSICIILTSGSTDTNIDPVLIHNRCWGCCPAQIITCYCAKRPIRIHGNTIQIAAFCRKIYVSVVISNRRTNIADHIRTLVNQLSGMCINRIQNRRVCVTCSVIRSEYQIIFRCIGSCPVEAAFVIIFPCTVFYLIPFGWIFICNRKAEIRARGCIGIPCSRINISVFIGNRWKRLST